MTAIVRRWLLAKAKEDLTAALTDMKDARGDHQRLKDNAAYAKRQYRKGSDLATCWDDEVAGARRRQIKAENRVAEMRAVVKELNR